MPDSVYPNPVDFTSIFNIQRNYLADLSAITTTGGATSSYYNSLKDNLNQLYVDFSNSSPASSVALDHQTQMSQILAQENQRLAKKKVGIDNAYYTQQRLIQLNESYREKNMAYINILVIIIIAIIIYLALLIMSKNLPFIPPFVINLSMALLFTGTLITVLVLYSKIQKRDPMNYQKLLFVPPDGNVYLNGNIYGNTNLGFNFATCVGEYCCGNGTTWSATYGNCVVTSPFTLMSDCGTCGNIMPYFPFEYEQYAKV